MIKEKKSFYFEEFALESASENICIKPKDILNHTESQ